MSMQVTGPDGRTFSVASDNTVYDGSNNAVGHVDPGTGRYVGNDGASISLAELATQGFVFPDGYVASNGAKYDTSPPSNDVLPHDTSEPTGQTGVASAIAYNDADGDASRAHVAAEVIDALRDPTFQPANPGLAATVVTNLETLADTYASNMAGLAPSIEQWIAIGQQVLASGTRVEAAASSTDKAELAATAIAQAQALNNEYFLSTDPAQAEATAAALFKLAASFSGSPAETQELEAVLAKAKQLLDAGHIAQDGEAGTMKPALPYNPALGAPIYMPVTNMNDLLASTAYKYASATDQERMRAFVGNALANPSAPNGLTDRWFNVQVARQGDSAIAGPTAEQLAAADALERLKRDTPDPFDTGTAWIGAYLEEHPFDFDQAKRDAYDFLVKQANDTYQSELSSWTRDQQLNAGYYAANGSSTWPKPTPPVLDEAQLQLRAEAMANQQKQQRDDQIAAFYNQVGQQHTAQRMSEQQSSQAAWVQLLDTEVERVQSAMSSRGFTSAQIDPYLDMVRQQFYGHPFEADGSHPTAFTWIPPDFFAVMLERGNA